jgi:beta-galactosidase
MSNRAEVFLSGDPSANPDAAGWKFNKGDVMGAEAPTLDDSGWTGISVPYTWNALDGENGPITTPAYYTGIGWYRKHYTIPSSMMGKRIYLQFDESAYLTDVYLNGMHVGTHAGGYARFRFDVTSLAMVGADNVIAVKVDNSAAVSPSNIWIGGTTADVAPLSGDFTRFGGIERDVRVLATDNLAITPLDFGGPGVYLKADSVSASSAMFTATVRLLNMNTAAKTASVEVDLLDEMNNTVQAFTGMQAVPAGMTADAVVSGQVMSPHLWNGLADPYVYHVNVIVKDGTTVTDAIVQPFGFRSFSLDPNTGFSLNGKGYPLHGVAMHQDHHDKGGQFSYKDPQYLGGIVNDFGLLKEIGSDFLRCAHYQHSDFTYAMADYRGIVTWAENAFVNRIPLDCTTDCTAFIADTQQQITELIRQNYNHPAVLFWSLGNEILLRPGPNPLPVMQNLAKVAEMEDPSRTVVFAANAGTEANASDWTPQATFFNEYYGWYYQKVGGLGAWADGVHAAHPNTPIGLSEYGAGCNPADHGLPIVETGTDRTGTFQTEEYQAFFHEQYWAQIATRPFLTITSVWNMFDFASDYRNEGNEPGLNTKGLVTYDRSTKKDSFWLYKANWSQDPVTYITSRRYMGFPKASTTIKAYSNQSALELKLNGTSLGMQTSATHVFQWNNVAWASGMNQVSVAAMNCTGGGDTMACSDQVAWAN